jgi:dipeptidyl aminopeptidase/acylaminoacyl peptidase
MRAWGGVGYAVALVVFASTCGGVATAASAAEDDYRTPSPAVVRLLTATPPPQPIVHARSGRVGLLFLEAVVPLERLARPFFGLAGFRFEPISRTSGIQPLVTRVEVVDAGAAPTGAPIEWRPSGALDYVTFSPDGRRLSGIALTSGAARLAIFDVETGTERVLDVPVNPAWGNPCTWVATDALLCRLVPQDLGPVPAARIAPEALEHTSGPAPTRVYANLLESSHEDALFEHYFSVELGRVGLDGTVRRLPARGLFETVEPSPDGAYAVVTRIERPFPRLVPAPQFPSSVEVWDLARGERRYASRPMGFGTRPAKDGREDPTHFAWLQGHPTALGWIERTFEDGEVAVDRWMALDAPDAAAAREIARSPRPIRSFGWTSTGTPYFVTTTDGGAGVHVHVVTAEGARELWSGTSEDRYNDPGHPLRVDGDQGPVLEANGRIFIAADGLGPQGPRPFLDALELPTGRRERIFTAEQGVFERVLAVLDPATRTLVTSRETERDPPNLFAVRGDVRTALRPYTTPYPDLEGVQRRVVTYRREDGVGLSGTLYLPANHSPGTTLPTVLWIYPYEFSDREQAEQLDVRLFQFHKVAGPSPLSLLLSGYAVLLNPTVPIVHETGGATDAYLTQLVASAEAAVDHLVATGIAQPSRIGVGGRSYGAFSSANLMVHSRRFATAVAMSGAYNRTLTPFGFQHERRSFWQATQLYANISPFFHVDKIEAPILLVHGGADDNPGTPTLQARRFFHALVGEGVPVRYVELPFEGHHYWARENVLDAAAEMIAWFDRTIGTQREAASAP